jgi:hypothetical protein
MPLSDFLRRLLTQGRAKRRPDAPDPHRRKPSQSRRGGSKPLLTRRPKLSHTERRVRKLHTKLARLHSGMTR